MASRSQVTVPPNCVKAKPVILMPGLRPSLSAATVSVTHLPVSGSVPTRTRSGVRTLPKGIAPSSPHTAR